jgi:hypothetical protein
MFFLAPVIFCFALQVPETASASPENEFTRAVQYLSEKHKVVIVADAYQGPVPSIDKKSITDVPIKIALHTLCTASNYTFELSNGIYLLRRNNGPAIRRSFSQPGNTYLCQREGKAQIFFPKGLESITADLPEYGIETTAVSLQLLGKELTKAGHPVHISPELAPQRVIVCAPQVRIPTLMESIGRLFNATPEITLKRSPRQAIREDLQGQYLPPDLVARRTISAELIGEVLESLSPEDKQARARGEFIDVKLSALPEKLKERLSLYVRFSFEMSSKELGMLGTPDWSKIEQFELRLKPSGTPGEQTIGVGVLRTDGSYVVF